MVVIGVVGPFGSGASYIADIISETLGLEIISLSNILRGEYSSRNPGPNPDRTTLQQFGNDMRRDNPSYLAEKACRIIETKSGTQGFILDSIRNPSEVQYFKNNLMGFFLLGVFADKNTRWERVKTKYNSELGRFEADEYKDRGIAEEKYGQRVTDCFKYVDITFNNNKNVAAKGNKDYRTLVAKISKYINNIIYAVSRNPDKIEYAFYPNEEETYMTMAYAVSLRSSCLKRQVGAVIVDNMGTVFSSGYNEVPNEENPCKDEFDQCNRDRLKKDFEKELSNITKEGIEPKSLCKEFFKKFKILDYCRALHAEENAIISVARTGATEELLGATLYTTTFPCNLCANKIAQVGIKKVIYFEPYPMEEAKKILERNHVEMQPFEGATFNGYFRLMEAEK